MITTKYEEHEQIELVERIQAIGINLVTCGDCGTVLLTETAKDVTCYSCGLTLDQADCPDLFYRGMELVTEA